jgi:hypothetical protein
MNHPSSRTCLVHTPNIDPYLSKMLTTKILTHDFFAILQVIDEPHQVMLLLLVL